MIASVYCSGSIVKGVNDDKKLCWGDIEKKQVEEGANPFEVVFLNPDDPITDPGNVLGQFGRDMYQVSVASVVIVDARERRGLGIGVEMAAAASLGTPVVVVAPRNSKYRSDTLEYRGVTINDYVHPHVASLAVEVVDDFTEAGVVLRRLPRKSTVPSADVAWLRDSIGEYVDNVLAHDPPMLEALHRLGIDSRGSVGCR
ncbi:MAG TPA: hypothetical protein VNO31_16865 [Umezawaea sp.]|nr:hypothetical protein [Umezawaea sp.]